MKAGSKRSRHRLLLAGAAVLMSTILTATALAAADLWAHRRYRDEAGYNIWGYRGPVVGRKQPGETRFVMLGGSTAFGYGVKQWESIEAQLERKLRARRPAAPTTVVNLAFMGEGAYSFQFTLKDYRYLDYDTAILYEGYNDSNADPNRSVFRHTSPVFVLTGYMPILPIVLREKAMLLRTGGDLNAAYRGEKVVFTPSLADRSKAGAVAAASRVSDALSHQLARFAKEQAARTGPPGGGSTGCGRWDDYCGSMSVAVDYLLSEKKSVLVVAQPILTSLHVEQQHALEQMLAERYRGNPHVRYFNPGTHGAVVDMGNKSDAFDGMHLSASGNERIAEALVAPALEMMGSR